MSHSRTAVVALALWVGSCSSSPVVSSVTPPSGNCLAPEGVGLRIAGSALGPAVQVDLSGEAPRRLVVRVGPAELTGVRVLGGGAVVEGTLPGGRLTSGGTYDVTVRTVSGATATLAGAFRCEGEPPDAGDGGEADGAEDDGVDDGGGEADASGPVGPVVTITDDGPSGSAASTASVAWVRDRWVVAFVENSGGGRALRLAEIRPGGNAVAAVVDVPQAEAPSDPLVRALAGRAGLAWVSGATDEYFFLVLDEDLAALSRAIPVALAVDTVWRRDHDLAPGPAGLPAFVGLVGDSAADAVVAAAILDEDGAVAVPAAPVGSAAGSSSEPRAVWAGGAFRLAWREGAADASRVRVASVSDAGAVTAGPADLVTGVAAGSPALALDDRGGDVRLLACWETVGPGDSRGLARGFFDAGFGSPSAREVVVSGTRGARCAAAAGFVAWSAWTSSPTVFVDLVAPDGSFVRRLPTGGRNVRALTGVDIAAGAVSHAVVWIEQPVRGGPAAVRFAEIRSDA